MTERQCVVYGLTDTRRYGIRYVGQTIVTPRRRFSAHVTAARSGKKSPLYNWMRKVWSDGGDVRFVVLCPWAHWAETEVKLIAMYKRMGFDLLNMTEGGDGALGYQHTAEHRARLSEAARRRGK